MIITTHVVLAGYLVPAGTVLVTSEVWMVYNAAADQKFILGRNHSVLYKPTAGFRNLFFDRQEASVNL